MKNQETVLVSIVFNEEKDKSILIVGKKNPRQAVDVINVFQGEEAEELYKKLVGEKKDADISE